MSDSTTAPPLTARTFLFGDRAHGDGVPSLSRALEERGAARTVLQGVRHLSSSALRAVDEEVGTVADRLLDLDLGDAMVSGWRKYSALTESARRTLAAPGSEEVVVLATHRATSTYRPHVDLLVDGVKVNSFEFELTVVFDVTGVSAIVRAGDLVALRGGECLVTTTLGLEGAQLAERQRHVDLDVIVPLRSPIPLVDEDTAALQRQPTDGPAAPAVTG